jgi:hypothetical protein
MDDLAYPPGEKACAASGEKITAAAVVAKRSRLNSDPTQHINRAIVVDMFPPLCEGLFDQYSDLSSDVLFRYALDSRLIFLDYLLTTSCIFDELKYQAHFSSKT